MISVIIPMYNAESTIHNCIESVLKQTYKAEIEIIIVNDGSTDNSKLLVEDIIRNNISKIFIKLINKENGGVSSARNYGIKSAKGEYIALLDSDDEWLSERLDKQINILDSNNNISLIGGLITNKTYDKPLIIEISLRMLIFKNYFQPSTVLFKREIVEKIGYFDESQKYAEEGNFFIRIANSYRCVLINEKLVNYGQGKHAFGISGLSANLIEMEKGELRNLQYAYKHGYINFITYLSAFIFSIIKYLRRIYIVKIKMNV
jgi:glycosyltransferase involved in cell wall biosynthesis